MPLTDETSPPGLDIRPLEDDRELIELTVSWHIDEFDPGGDVAAWIRARTDEALGKAIPRAWIAFSNGEPVGSVSLVADNMDGRHPDLTPWLAALYVVPDRRRIGIGSALARVCERGAAAAGASKLYLFTSTARDFYRRLEWTDLIEDRFEGEDVTIMHRSLARSSEAPASDAVHAY
jgi:predicted N-acetyltransferase YhbS